MNTITVEPFPRTNPRGNPDGAWAIYHNQGGTRTRIGHTDSLDKAQRRAERAAEKRGAVFAGARWQAEHEEAPPVADEPDAYLRVTKPREAPAIGKRVRVKCIDDVEYDATVTSYLASQFVVKRDDGAERIVHCSERWELIT